MENIEDVLALMAKASEANKSMVRLTSADDGFYLWSSHAEDSEDLEAATPEQVIQRLKEWAYPPPPESFVIIASYKDVETLAKLKNISTSLSSKCRELIEPFESPLSPPPLAAAPNEPSPLESALDGTDLIPHADITEVQSIDNDNPFL